MPTGMEEEPEEEMEKRIHATKWRLTKREAVFPYLPFCG
jgi:hypothetical protein